MLCAQFFFISFVCMRSVLSCNPLHCMLRSLINVRIETSRNVLESTCINSNSGKNSTNNEKKNINSHSRTPKPTTTTIAQSANIHINSNSVTQLIAFSWISLCSVLFNFTSLFDSRFFLLLLFFRCLIDSNQNHTRNFDKYTKKRSFSLFIPLKVKTEKSVRF